MGDWCKSLYGQMALLSPIREISHWTSFRWNKAKWSSRCIYGGKLSQYL